MSFVQLHCHSTFSFHAGVPSVPEIVGRAKDLGMPAVGLTDTDRMSGLILHYEECRRQGIRPILGAELTEPRVGEVLAARARSGAAGQDIPSPAPSRADPAELSPRADGAGSHRRERLVLLARNAQGYADLCDILTERHLSAHTFAFERVFEREWPNSCCSPRRRDCSGRWRRRRTGLTCSPNSSTTAPRLAAAAARSRRWPPPCRSHWWRPTTATSSIATTGRRTRC